jgi:hypothetical protein
VRFILLTATKLAQQQHNIIHCCLSIATLAISYTADADMCSSVQRKPSVGVFTATVVMRTRHNITLYRHCLIYVLDAPQNVLFRELTYTAAKLNWERLLFPTLGTTLPIIIFSPYDKEWRHTLQNTCSCLQLHTVLSIPNSHSTVATLITILPAPPLSCCTPHMCYCLHKHSRLCF